jgi:hypothetical protein
MSPGKRRDRQTYDIELAIQLTSRTAESSNRRKIPTDCTTE